MQLAGDPPPPPPPLEEAQWEACWIAEMDWSSGEEPLMSDGTP